MTLRSRLTAAFFAISVLPLSAVTLFSYVSSERALRRAAEQQANELADDLSRRMQWVTTDIERRLNRAWPTAMPSPSGSGWQRRAAAARTRGGSMAQPVPAAPRPAQPAQAGAGADQVVGRLAGVFGEWPRSSRDSSFTPTPPKGPAVAPAAPGGPRAARSPAGAAGPGRTPETGPGSPDGDRPDGRRGAAAIAEAMKQYQAGKVPKSTEDIAAWTEKLQQQIRLGLARFPPPNAGCVPAAARGRAHGSSTIDTGTARSEGSPPGR